MSLHKIARSIAPCALAIVRSVQHFALLGMASLLAVVRSVLLSLLVVFEPIFSFFLSAIAALGIVTAVVFETSAVGETFPFLLTFAFSVGSAMALMAYRVVLRSLTS